MMMKRLFFLLFLGSASLFAYGGSCGFGRCGYGGCSDCCCLENIYFGVEGGFTSGIGHAKGAIGVGELQNGIAVNPHFLPGYNLGARIGYDLSPCVTFDVSYTYFGSEYHWETILGTNFLDGLATTDKFEAHIDSHVVLFNMNVNLDRLCCSPVRCTCVTPYLFGGLGAAWNHLHKVREFASIIDLLPPILVDRIGSHTHSGFAARFGIGFIAFLSDCFTFDTGLHATFIGEVRTADFLQLPDSEDKIPISPFEFKHNWLGSFYIGATYRF